MVGGGKGIGAGLQGVGEEGDKEMGAWTRMCGWKGCTDRVWRKDRSGRKRPRGLRTWDDWTRGRASVDMRWSGLQKMALLLRRGRKWRMRDEG